MKAHDIYYGQALREAESGRRRDDLWGKAFALAKGDTQKASGIYLDLLAARLEADAGSPERVANAQDAKAIVGTVGILAVEGTRKIVEFSFRWTIRAALCVALAFGLTYAGTDVYSAYSAKQLTDRWVPAQQAAQREGVRKFRSMQLTKGNPYSEDEIRSDFEHLEYTSLLLKYGDEGSYELDRLFSYDPYTTAERESRVNSDTSFLIGAVIFFAAFGTCTVDAWRRYFYNRKRASNEPAPQTGNQ